MKKNFCKALVLGVLGMSLAFSTPVINAHADAEENVVPVYTDTIQQQDAVTTFASQLSFDFTKAENGTEKYQDLLLTVDKDCVARLSVSALESSGGNSWGELAVYQDALKANKVFKLRYNSSTANPETATDYIHFVPGTYYLRVSAHRNNYRDENVNIKPNIGIIATESSKLFGVTSQPTGSNKYNLVFQKTDQICSGIYVFDKDWNYDIDDYSYHFLKTSESAYTVEKPGVYTVAYKLQSDALTPSGKGIFGNVATKVTIAGNGKPVTADTKKTAKKKTTTKKKSNKIPGIKVSAKRGTRKVTVTTVKKASVKIKIGKKTYKGKANSKGKAVIKTSNLKKKLKFKVTVSKKGYMTRTKTYMII